MGRNLSLRCARRKRVVHRWDIPGTCEALANRKPFATLFRTRKPTAFFKSGG